MKVRSSQVPSIELMAEWLRCKYLKLVELNSSVAGVELFLYSKNYLTL